MALKEHLEFLASETAFWMLGLDNPDYPMDQLGKLSERVSEQLRALAIISLLAEGDTDLFYHNLLRSGVARITFLERCRQANYRDFHLAISRNTALFDILAAGDVGMARSLVALSPQEWLPDGEYEDDFCYIRFIHLLVQGEDAVVGAAPALLKRHEASLDGDFDVRRDLCKAFLTRKQDEFDGAFEALLMSHATQIQRDKERGRMEDPEVLAERQVFVEGLGLLKLAADLGFETRETYRFCPVSARDPMIIPFPGR